MRARQLMGVLPDGLAMPERLSGRELLTLIGEMRGPDPDVIAQRAQDLLEVMGLTGAERTLIVDYSTGMSRRSALPPPCCTPRGCSCSTSRSRSLTRYRRQPSGGF
jgi:ABC-2 type transport system ATP-binding protein